MYEELLPDSSTSEEAAMRHPKLYFPTGDLVVSARHPVSGRLHLFRVHTVILAQFSPVFADMLQMPASLEGKETYDGVPSVHFPDDVRDVVELFQVFYQPGYPFLHQLGPQFASKVYGLMRIATKYQVDSLCDAIKSHLKSQWPPSLGGLLRLQADMESVTSGLPKVAGVDDKATRDIFSVFPEPAAAIRLATDFDVPSILPIAYYILSTVHFGSVPRIGERDTKNGTVANRFKLLSDQELLRYYQGKYSLMKTRLEAHTQVKTCFRKCACNEEDDEDIDDDLDCVATLMSLQDWVKRDIDEDPQCLFRADPIQTLEQLRKKLSSKMLWEDICPVCYDSTIKRILDAMKRIWDDLPKMFSLPMVAPDVAMNT